MYLFSILMIGNGIAFGALAVLLAHEALTDGGKSPVVYLRRGLDRAVTCAVLEYDRDPVFGAAVPFILFVVLPGAAALNALLGGSPMLILGYGLIALSVFAHLLMAEIHSLALVRGLLSTVAALLVLVAAPFYAVWSLSEHQMHALPAQAALSGLLICIILYAGNAGLWTLLRTGADAHRGTAIERFFAAFLFALPVGYVLYWFVLLIVNMTVGDAVSGQYRNWLTLLLFDLSVGAVFAVFMMLADTASSYKNGHVVVVSAAIGILALIFGLTI